MIEMPWTRARKAERVELILTGMQLALDVESARRRQRAEEIACAEEDQGCEKACAAEDQGCDIASQAAEEIKQQEEREARESARRQERDAQEAYNAYLTQRMVAKCDVINKSPFAPVSTLIIQVPVSFPTYALVTEHPQPLADQVLREAIAVLTGRHQSGETYALLSQLAYNLRSTIEAGAPVREAVSNDPSPAPSWMTWDIPSSAEETGTDAKEASAPDQETPESEE